MSLLIYETLEIKFEYIEDFESGEKLNFRWCLYDKKSNVSIGEIYECNDKYIFNSFSNRYDLTIMEVITKFMKKLTENSVKVCHRCYYKIYNKLKGKYLLQVHPDKHIHNLLEDLFVYYHIKEGWIIVCEKTHKFCLTYKI